MNKILLFDGENELFLAETAVAEISNADRVVELFINTACYRAAALKEPETAAEKLLLVDRGYNALIGRLFTQFGEEDTLQFIASVDLDLKLSEL